MNTLDLFLIALVLSAVPAVLYFVYLRKLCGPDVLKWADVGAAFLWGGGVVFPTAWLVEPILSGGDYHTQVLYVAPIFEESLKAVWPLLMYYRSNDPVLSMSTGAAVGLSYAAVENADWASTTAFGSMALLVVILVVLTRSSGCLLFHAGSTGNVSRGVSKGGGWLIAYFAISVFLHFLNNLLAVTWEVGPYALATLVIGVGFYLVMELEVRSIVGREEKAGVTETWHEG